MKRFALTFFCAFSIHAYPPAPHHTFQGVVRDQFGSPIQSDTAEVILETPAGVRVTTKIRPNLESGMNYRLETPMDAGLTGDAYVPTALRPAMPFKIKVRIGTTTYVPIEMNGDFSHLGQPGEITRLNLTLGEDSDGDGLPDAWERALISLLGGGKTLAEINANQDTDGDGLSNGDEYFAGTYAFDPKNGFALKLLDLRGNAATVEFTAVPGRTYIIQGSSDLSSWTDVQFRITAEGQNAPYRPGIQASDVRLLRVEIAPDDAGYKFFKLLVQ